MAIKRSGKAAEKKLVKVGDIKVDRAKDFEESISFDATLYGTVKIYGMTYRTWTDKDGVEKGIISFPSKKGKYEKYYNHAYFYVSDEVLADVEKQIEALI